MVYKLIKRHGEIIGAFIQDGEKRISFPFVEGNTDYQAYLKWLDEGNQPEPAEEI